MNESLTLASSLGITIIARSEDVRLQLSKVARSYAFLQLLGTFFSICRPNLHLHNPKSWNIHPGCVIQTSPCVLRHAIFICSPMLEENGKKDSTHIRMLNSTLQKSPPGHKALWQQMQPSPTFSNTSAIQMENDQRLHFYFMHNLPHSPLQSPILASKLIWQHSCPTKHSWLTSLVDKLQAIGFCKSHSWKTVTFLSNLTPWRVTLLVGKVTLHWTV